MTLICPRREQATLAEWQHAAAASGPPVRNTVPQPLRAGRKKEQRARIAALHEKRQALQHRMGHVDTEGTGDMTLCPPAPCPPVTLRGPARRETTLRWHARLAIDWLHVGIRCQGPGCSENIRVFN